MHGSTITRWIKAGRLPARRLASGELEIDEAALDELLEARPSPTRTAGVGSAAVALAVAEERIHGLEMLVETQRGWLADAEARLGLVLQSLAPSGRRESSMVAFLVSAGGNKGLGAHGLFA